MKSTIKLVFQIWLVLLLCVACVKNSAEPKDPLWNKESCARCRMTISEKYFAVQRVFSDGRIYYYDDLNCALRHEKFIDIAQSEIYVFPQEQAQWIKAAEAKFNNELVTPMGSGFGAVTNGKFDFNHVRSVLGSK